MFDEMIKNSVELARCGFPTVQTAGGASLFNNTFIAIAKDFIFGLSVWDGKTFVPMSELEEEDLETCIVEINKGTLNFPWREDLAKLLKRFNKGE